jgi:hypothetical protein
MTRAPLSCVAILLILSSCTQRLVCPAYQSAFIFDKPTAREKFVYYNESTTAPKEILASNSKSITLPPRDSSWVNSTVLPGPALPQVKRVKMDKYLLLPEKSYKKAMKALQTVEMKQVLPKKEEEVDSLDIMNELDSAARSITDTLTVQAIKGKPEEKVDSVYAITKTKEKYNMDQDIYMWYFRDILVLPDVRAAMQEKKEEAVAEEKKTRQGLFKRLFGKKNKKAKASDSLEVENAASDTTAVRKKKRSFNPFKKKNAEVGADDKKKKSDPAKKEEEDDGFGNP